MKSTFINGLRVFGPTSRSELIKFAFAKKSILVAVNAEKILNANENIRGIINNNLGYPDGIGAVFCLRRRGLSNAIKIPGCELWLDIIQLHHQDKSFYLVGGTEDVIGETVSKLKQEFPNIEIVGHRNGYFEDRNSHNALLIDIQTKRPDVVFVAMGSPRQEMLMREMYESYPALYQGLGGSFDVYTGRVRRAPEFWINLNLEWLYRLISEPSRIWRQARLLKFVLLFISRRY